MGIHKIITTLLVTEQDFFGLVSISHKFVRAPIVYVCTDLFCELGQMLSASRLVHYVIVRCYPVLSADVVTLTDTFA